MLISDSTGIAGWEAKVEGWATCGELRVVGACAQDSLMCRLGTSRAIERVDGGMDRGVWGTDGAIKLVDVDWRRRAARASAWESNR